MQTLALLKRALCCTRKMRQETRREYSELVELRVKKTREALGKMQLYLHGHEAPSKQDIDECDKLMLSDMLIPLVNASNVQLMLDFDSPSFLTLHQHVAELTLKTDLKLAEKALSAPYLWVENLVDAADSREALRVLARCITFTRHFNWRCLIPHIVSGRWEVLAILAPGLRKEMIRSAVWESESLGLLAAPRDDIRAILDRGVKLVEILTRPDDCCDTCLADRECVENHYMAEFGDAPKTSDATDFLDLVDLKRVPWALVTDGFVEAMASSMGVSESATARFVRARQASTE